MAQRIFAKDSESSVKFKESTVKIIPTGSLERPLRITKHEPLRKARSRKHE